jgi:hypothetical protein
MRFTENVGVVASTGDAFKPEKVEMMYIAEGAITVGKQVEISDSTAYPFGGAVLSGTTAADHAACGIYEGQSEGRGARTATSGLAGFDALAGETIFVTVHGPVVLLAFASTTDSTIAALDALDFSGSAGVARRLAAPAAGLVGIAIALEAQTVSSTGGTPTDAFVRFM